MRITKLDGLRGVFCLMVVMYHLGLTHKNIVFEALFKQSYYFVDFFFVLSGFVISINYDNLIKTKDQFVVYIKKRFARLYPLLFWSVAIMFVIEYIGSLVFPSYKGFDLDFQNLIQPLIFTNSTPLLGDVSGINGPSWSISAEMISYLAFGLFTLFFTSKIKNVASIVLIVLSYYLLFQFGDFAASSDYGFLRGFVGFFLGYLVYKIKDVKVSINNNLEYAIPVLLFIVFYLFWLYSDNLMITTILSVFIPILFGIFIFILLKTNGFISKILETRPFQYLGELSYSIYLNHHLIYLMVKIILFKIIQFEFSLGYQILYLVVTVFVTIIYSHFTYKYVELKGGKFLRGFLLKKR